jgi:hypothetical protein
MKLSKIRMSCPKTTECDELKVWEAPLGTNTAFWRSRAPICARCRQKIQPHMCKNRRNAFMYYRNFRQIHFRARAIYHTCTMPRANSTPSLPTSETTSRSAKLPSTCVIANVSIFYGYLQAYMQTEYNCVRECAPNSHKFSKMQ